MLIAVWTVSAVLALAYLISGGTKAIRPYEKVKVTMDFAEDFAPWQVRVIGIIEVLGALGLILPELLHVAIILAPIAAVGLAVVQVLAIVVHLRRHDDLKRLPVNVVLLALAVFVAVARFAGV
jgi:DoxX-like family